ncbi:MULTISPECIES: copper resistance CopC family protein [Micromonospora]|uniref:Copper resistance protein CopC n=1 Tax=Micromonospora solifontis TaxID=2487138 RepID=A0ABX9WFC7_9ACTN|nr:MULTISPECIES: copper resistance CopC family protein [Micromonospora]NES13932.1 copper resistance protein CopC [Micromonospora sp. PPF5-17B]NES37509.1 copper resistance protein CopC [Micromonospora solifontis]NES54032.1 copper resistance protein CopC [Micromonospora sp. PPF5-6]RNL98315.1 copper resistance protein CopC [Micromonospora solifontis]
MGGRTARAVRAWSVVLGAACGVSTLLPAAPAAAHNSLTGSDPKDGARVATAPERIELRFLATPARDTTKITVTGPDHAAASSGAPAFSGKRVSVPFTPGPAGVYTVAYQVGSTDGHPVKGQLSFTLTAGAPAAPTSAPATAGPAAAPTSAPASPAPAASPADSSGGAGWWWAGGAVVVLLALGGGLLMRRRTTGR